LIYRDGYTQLCVRDPGTGEYIVYDEYGLIWVYSGSSLLPALAEHLAERETELITKGGHYRRRLPTSDQQSAEFVESLGLERVA